MLGSGMDVGAMGWGGGVELVGIKCLSWYGCVGKNVALVSMLRW